MKQYPRLRLTHGRKVLFRDLFTHFSRDLTVKKVLRNNLRLVTNFQVLEVRPVIDWDKGKAVTFLLESLGKFIVFI